MIASDAAAASWASLPQWALVGAGIVGVVLWLFGHATLKLGFGVIGLLAGGLAGYLVPSVVGAAVHPGVPAAFGALAGLAAGLISFRFSVALVQGVVLSVIAGVLVFVVVAPSRARELKNEVAQNSAGETGETTPARGLELEVRAVAGQSERGAEGGTGAERPDATEETLEQVRESLKGVSRTPAVDFALRSADDLRDTTHRLADKVRPVWNDLPREQRTGIALAAIGAGTVGFGLGMFFPKRSSAGVTALAGAMLWTPALMELLARSSMRVPMIDVSDTWTRAAAVGVIAVIGTCIQWAMTRRGADKA